MCFLVLCFDPMIGYIEIREAGRHKDNDESQRPPIEQKRREQAIRNGIANCCPLELMKGRELITLSL